MDPLTLALIMGGSALAQGGLSFFGAQSAASAQTQAQQNAIASQQAMFGQIMNTVLPYIQQGTEAEGALSPLIGAAPGTNPMTAPLTKPFTTQDIENTPGYQFLLNQGLKSTQNSYAAQGLGSSGSALRGAADYTNNLTMTTVPQWMQTLMNQRQQTYNLLAGPMQTGAQATGTLAGAGPQFSSGIAGSMSNIGQAQGAADIYSANAASGAINNLGNSYLQYTLLNRLMGGGGAGNGTVGASSIAMPGVNPLASPAAA